LLPATMVVALVWAVVFLHAERCFRMATAERR
jgi:hypothetical protein